MIDLEFVESLIRALDDSSLDSLELERGGTRIRLSKSPVPCAPIEMGVQATSAGAIAGGQNPVPTVGREAAVPGGAPVTEAMAQAEEAPSENLLEVTSPMVGTFYRAPSPEAPSYVDVGSHVGEGSVLCIIEAMKLMNELESEVTGTVVKIMVENAEPVEFGQLLFLVDPS